MSMETGQLPHKKPKAGGRTCVYRVFAEYILVMHSGNSPADDEWADLVRAFRESDLKNLRILVFTYGGAPSARQRAAINNVLRDHEPRIAIMTPSAFARAVGTAMTWFNPHMALFGPDQLSEAMKHLGSPEHDRPRLRLVLSELERELERLSGAPPARAGIRM
ncbi:MAG: hypothetical protein SFV15_09235 [Polyangiaceae bacterium]|nr:hypothetical protein [Polyangiaceae bacterium]